MTTDELASPVGAAASRATPEETPRERLERHLGGGGIPRHLVYVAAKLGLAEVLADSRDPATSSRATLGAHTDLCAGASGHGDIGLLIERMTPFALADAGRLLRRDDRSRWRRVIKGSWGMAWVAAPRADRRAPS